MNIEPVRGLIELQDEFSSKLGLAEAALKHFTKENQESLKAVGVAAGLTAAAIGAIAFATVELGKRGSEVKDVDDSLEHFAGSAEAAKKIMDGLRQGTKDTVDNFTLAKDAVHLLSAGVKLGADDFTTLGQAAFVLKTRGLGGTKEQLELVSDALVTGRTRALAMSLGVIDAGDAEENYARKLGVSKDMLSLTGQAEAKRIQVMAMLNAAVKDAGDQEKTFGDRLKSAQTTMENWLDDLSKAVAESPVLAAGLKAIESAVTAAFGGDSTESIKMVVHWIEQAAIVGVNFALGAIEMARIVNVAWSAIKVMVLGTETVLMGIATGIVTIIATVADAASHLPGGDIFKDVAEGAEAAAMNLAQMTKDLSKQTDEAAKGVTGDSEFDKTLDHLGGTLFQVKDAMEAASNATDDNSKKVNIAAANAKKLHDVQEELNRKMLDGAKVTAALVKSTTELNNTWDDYFKLVAQHSGTSRDAQIADIEATFDKQVRALDALDPLFAEKYKAYRAIADEQLNAISSDWDSVKDRSIQGMQEQADKALETYNRMATSGLRFSREVLEEQLDKYKELQAKANGWGETATKAVTQTAQAVQMLDHAWVTDADIAAATINKTTIMVKTLSGELISLAEAQKRQQQGGSFDVTSQNFAETLKKYLSTGVDPATGTGTIQYQDPYNLAKKGYSFAEILKYAYSAAYMNTPLPPAQGPRIPGFREGGVVDIKTGENGPEVVRVPLGTTVYPSGMNPGGGPVYNLTFNVNGTAQESARAIKTILMRELKTVRQFPAS